MSELFISKHDNGLKFCDLFIDDSESLFHWEYPNNVLEGACQLIRLGDHKGNILSIRIYDNNYIDARLNDISLEPAHYRFEYDKTGKIMFEFRKILEGML